ncbi:hypothetical protein MNBD_GAMMA22-3010 [hydrothermal vent metagenome]|uniref:Uncharacterized protein n=1 Tax=hydrothermal vent metagenome TaxID=652676 RepID=A0A3B1A4D6_9ZZZZ
MKIIYKNANWRDGDSSSNVLGVVEHKNIPEVLIPFHKDDHASSFIAKKFIDNDSTIIWEVVDVVHTDVTIEVSLAGINSPTSLATQAKNMNRKVTSLVSPYCLVEVDFGHKTNLAGAAGITDVNTWDMSTHLPAEMYKKRPCVVLAIDGNRVQVIPISTSERAASDYFHIKLTMPSFNKLHSRYKSKPSYILTKMVQTVSAYRVYPPKLVNGKFAPNCNPNKLCSADKANLLKMLSSIYSKGLVEKNISLEKQIDRLNVERRSLLNTKVESERSALTQEKQLIDLKEKISKIGERYDILGDAHVILDDILS